MNHPKRKREGLKAKKRLQTIGKALVNYYTKQKARKKFCRRAGIEPVIGHIKQDHRMQRNYLKGTQGDAINTMLAAAGYNLKHWLNKLIFVFKTIYKIIIAEILNFLTLAQTKQKLMLANRKDGNLIQILLTIRRHIYMPLFRIQTHVQQIFHHNHLEYLLHPPFLSFLSIPSTGAAGLKAKWR